MNLALMFPDDLTARVMALVPPALKVDIPWDPPEIVLKNADGFSIDTKNMERFKLYMMTFMDSTYVIWKDRNDALVITEVEA